MMRCDKLCTEFYFVLNNILTFKIYVSTGYHFMLLIKLIFY